MKIVYKEEHEIILDFYHTQGKYWLDVEILPNKDIEKKWDYIIEIPPRVYKQLCEQKKNKQ